VERYAGIVIKSLKHDGCLHRMWKTNWRVPSDRMLPGHAGESMIVTINDRTAVQEADGREWISGMPAVSFFIPGRWFNIIALLGEDGTCRYYCNLASPPVVEGDVLTYVDYDLDVIREPDGSVEIVDRDEYERHRAQYDYPESVQRKIELETESLLERIRLGMAPFNDEDAWACYLRWRARRNGVQHESVSGEQG
jgi:hypothetical protein